MTDPNGAINPDSISILITAFARRWEDALKDTTSLRTEPSIANLISTLHIEIQKWLSRQTKTTFKKNGDGLHARLANLVNIALQQRRVDVSLLRRLRPADITSLHGVVSPAVINGPALAAALAPLVSTIESPMPAIAMLLGDILPRLGAELSATSSYDSDDLDGAAFLGARALLVYDRPDALKKAMKCWLSAGSAKVVLAECAPSMLADDALARKAQVAFHEVVSRIRLVDIEKRSAAFPEGLPSYSDLWRASTALTDAREDFEGALQAYASHLATGVASRALQIQLAAFLNETPPEVREMWDAVTALAAVFGNWFAERGWIRQAEGYWPWGGVLRDVCRGAIARSIVEPIVPTVLSQSSGAVELLRAWLQTAVRSTLTAGDKERMWYLADRTVQDGIVAFTSAIHSVLYGAINARIQILADGDTGDQGQVFDYSTMPTALADQAALSDDAWEWVQWGKLSGAQLSDALAPLSAAFSTDSEFDVVIPVSGASIEPTSWRSGILTWYTPATHSLGEAFVPVTEDSRKSSLHVWLRVGARGAEAAHERAQVVLEPALSALTFALSSSQTFSGFRPGTDVWFAYGKVDAGYGGWHGSRHRTEAADHRVSAKDLQSFSVVYASVVERAAGLGRQTEVEARLIRALFWYRSGRWQRNPARRFLDHFVALEHLFAPGAPIKDQAVADGVAALEGSWLHRGFPFSMQVRHTIDVARQLSSEAQSTADVGSVAQRVADDRLSGCPNALHWRAHISPWLSPSFVGAVGSLLAPRPLPSHWVAHIAALANLQAMEANWARVDLNRRNTAWFKVRLLAQRRHDIVHQALTYVPGIEYEAEALTDVVEMVLRYLVEDALTRPTAAATMQDILDGVAAPWLS